MRFSQIFFQVATLLLATISLVFAQFISTTADSSVIKACTTLSHQFPFKISFPGNTSFASTLSSYYTLQEQSIQPSCIISPNSTDGVSQIIKILTSSKAKFAVKSGGHMMNAGAANIDSGVVIDLRSIRTITAKALDTGEGKTIVSIGTGAKWGEVYEYLDPLRLATMGGRVSDIGVGGLTLGGGISFFSQQKGWVSENVQLFEIVLASGEILKASKNNHPDLFQALKFGSNNFGIVTRIDLPTWAQEDYLAGSIITPSPTADSQIAGFANLLDAKDPYAATILSFDFISALNSTVVNTQLAYTKPGVIEPGVLKPFMEAESQFVNTMRVSNTSSFAEEAWDSFPRDNRYQWATTTFVSSLPLLQAVYALWEASIPEISQVPNLSWILSLQPLPPNLSHSTLTGLSLSNHISNSSSTSSSVLVNIGFNYLSSEYDDLLATSAQKLIKNIEEEAKGMGKYVEFKYLNYATAWQDPLGSYGKEGLEVLKKVSRKYDPEGVFQGLCEGGFKISKAGGGSSG